MSLIVFSKYYDIRTKITKNKNIIDILDSLLKNNDINLIDNIISYFPNGVKNRIYDYRCGSLKYFITFDLIQHYTNNNKLVDIDTISNNIVYNRGIYFNLSKSTYKNYLKVLECHGYIYHYKIKGKGNKRYYRSYFDIKLKDTNKLFKRKCSVKHRTKICDICFEVDLYNRKKRNGLYKGSFLN